MKREWLFVSAGTVAVAVGLTVAPTGMAVGVGLVAGGTLVYWASRCRHGGRPGLLPPGTADDGTRLPARWFCDNCGRSWPAGIEHDRAPIVRFTGYDESKLPAAARRASALEKQRKTLAVRRAGQVGLAARRSQAVVSANVTPIRDRRVG